MLHDCDESVSYESSRPFRLEAGGTENVVPIGFRNPQLEHLTGRVVDEAAELRGTSPEVAMMDLTVALGRETIEKGRHLIEAAESEYRFRRNGLVVSLAFMVPLAAAIYLKIRDIESRD